MVDQPVDYRVGYHRVGEDLAPFGQGLVRRHDRRPPLVSAGDQLEEQPGDRLVHREVADLVDYQQPVPVQVLHRGLLPPLGQGPAEP